MKIDEVEKHTIKINIREVLSIIKYSGFSELCRIFVLVIIINAAIIILSVIIMFLIISIVDIDDIMFVDDGSINSDMNDKIISNLDDSHHIILLSFNFIVMFMAIIVNTGRVNVSIYFLIN